MKRRKALLGLLALPFIGKVASKIKEPTLDELRLKALEAVKAWPPVYTTEVRGIGMRRVTFPSLPDALIKQFYVSNWSDKPIEIVTQSGERRIIPPNGTYPDEKYELADEQT